MLKAVREYGGSGIDVLGRCSGMMFWDRCLGVGGLELYRDD